MTREEIINEINETIASERAHYGEAYCSDLIIDEEANTAYFYTYAPTGLNEELEAEYEPYSVEEFALDERLTRSCLCAPGYLWTEWSEW